MILVKLGRAYSECSAGELLHSDFKADRVDVSLEEKRVILAVSQERHVAAGNVQLKQ
jgi:hypothetical protein